MLINEFANSRGDTEESFRKGLTTRMRVYGIFALIGIAMIVALLIDTNGRPVSGGHLTSYQSGVVTGMGSAFIAAGILRFLKTRATLDNPDRFRKAYTESIDERNRFILMKTYHTASMVFIGGIALASLGASFVSITVANTLSICMGSFVAVVLVVRQIISRKY